MKFSPFCILLQLQRHATHKIASFCNYFDIFEECKGEKMESAHEFCRISAGCSCAKKKNPMRIKSNSLFLLCCMRACCKNAERHADSALRGGAATEDGQDI